MNLDAALIKINDGIEHVGSTMVKSDEKWAERHEAMNGNMAALDERISDLEKRIAKSITQKYGVGNDIPKSEWSWSRYCYAIAMKDWTYSPKEYELVKQYREKAGVTAGDFSAGGALVPPQYIAELIDFLRPIMISTQLGTTMLTGLTASPVMFPKLTAGATSFWIGPEGTAITASAQTTGMMQLQPHKIAALVKLSKEVTLLSNPSVEAAVRNDIVLTLAEGIDLGFFRGTGLNAQPVGLANHTPAINDPGDTWNSAAPTAAIGLENLGYLKNSRKLLAQDNALRGNLAWAVNVDSYETIDRQIDGNNRSWISDDVTREGGKRLLGWPILESTQVSASGTDTLYFGNWTDAVLAMWSTIAVESTTQGDTAFTNDELWIKATAMVDYGFRREQSFAQMLLVN